MQDCDAAQALRGGLGPGVHPHLVQLMVDGEQYGKHIELSPSVGALEPENGVSSMGCLQRLSELFSSKILTGPCRLHMLLHLHIAAVALRLRKSHDREILLPVQFVLECLHTRGVPHRPAIFGGAAAVGAAQ